jgi:hypothetical protein
MRLPELRAILEQTGFPVTYSHFKEDPERPIPSPPYIAYLVTYSSNLHADNKVYKKIDNIQIELYTREKELDTESILETILDENEIPYDWTETYIESEGLFQKLYESRLL